MSDWEPFYFGESKGGNSYSKGMIIGCAGLACLYFLAKWSDPQKSDDDKEDQARKPAGIYNQGNTCFVNSLLQALSSLESFNNNLSEMLAEIRPPITPNEELMFELSNVLKKINQAQSSISVDTLLNLIGQVKEGLINFEQQDAHQLYAALIGCFEDVLNRQKNFDLSASIKLDAPEREIQNALIGFTKSSIICISCKNETAIKIHPFYDLSLEIRPANVVDIASALKEFERQEIIQHWNCTGCTIKRHIYWLKQASSRLQGPNKEKLQRIAEDILKFLNNSSLLDLDVQELKKSLDNFMDNYRQQKQAMLLDTEKDLIFLEPKTIQSRIVKKTVITKFPRILVIHLKQLVINPYSGEPVLLRKQIGFQQTLQVNLKRPKNYILTSLLTHIGNQSMGHYYTFRRQNRLSQNWFVISDSNSRRCKWDYVSSSRAYMLFYEAEE